METLQEEHIPFEVVVTKTDKTNQKDLHKNTVILKKATVILLKLQLY